MVTAKLKIDGIGINERLIYRRQTPGPINDYEYKIKIENRSSETSPVLLFILYIDLNDPQSGTRLASFTISIGYRSGDKDTLIKTEDGKLIFSDSALERLLFEASISTARGILFSELKGTHLSRALLPMMTLDDIEQASATDTPDDQN